MKVCAEPGCPELATSPRCDTHTKARDKARGTREERGYGQAHRQARKAWAPKVATGKVNCWRCDTRIGVFDTWHLGHCDDDRTKYHGPEHEACNTATSSHGRCTHISHVS